MKLIDSLETFPPKTSLKGLPLEAYNLLQSADKRKPVLQLHLEGQNGAAVRRAFATAAKALGGSVETRDGDGGTILVRWSRRPGPARGRGSATPVATQHSEAAVAAEVARLWREKGPSAGPIEQADELTRRRLTISAKRNLSRHANKTG
ncbi:MAG TPA: hypothetical protein VMV93_08860 [Chloroflexota bacterium]|nr:hypothetical protein [Chloroflexota bacterium]